MRSQLRPSPSALRHGLTLFPFLAVIFVLLALLPHASHAALPSPLTSYGGTVLYGHDCAEYCLNGSAVLQPSVFGQTNQYCADARGCYWLWHMRFVPCSLALLAFDAEVGAATPAELFSDIDPAAHSSLGLYCVENGGTALIEVREAGATVPLMDWRYQGANCLGVLSNLAIAAANSLSGADINLDLAGQQWFGTGDQALLGTADACSDDDSSLLPCEQCFEGALELNIGQSNATTLVQQACGVGASVCTARWSFCYDACKQHTSLLTVRLGTLSLKDLVGPASAKTVMMRTGEPDQRGRTLFALTDVTDVQGIDDGRATFFLAWEYRLAPAEALWRAPARDALFVALHFGLETQDGVILTMSTAQGALGDYAWDGQTQTGINGLVHAATDSISGSKAGMVAGLVVLGVWGLIGWALLCWMYVVRGYMLHNMDTPSSGEPYATSVLLTETQSRSNSNISALAQTLRKTDVAKAHETVTAVAHDKSYLYTNSEQQRALEEENARQLAEAQQVLRQDYEDKGGRAGHLLRSLPGGTTLIEAARSGGQEYEKLSTRAVGAQRPM